MRLKPFFWHIFPSFLIVSGFSCIVLLLYMTREFKQFYIQHTVAELKKHTLLFKEMTKENYVYSRSSVDSLAIWAGQQTNTRFTVILSNGTVIGDSREDPSIMDNHNTRPEIQAALTGDTGVAIRHSATLARDLLYVAIPVIHKDSVTAVFRASVPLVSLSERMDTLYKKLFVTSILIICGSAMISIWLSRRLSKPLVHLKAVADTYADGNLQPVSLSDDHVFETAELAVSMDKMAKLLAERIATITCQKNEQNAILSSMIEGVVAVDLDEHIVLINEAAAQMLDCDRKTVPGKLVQEAVRNTALHRFVRLLIEEQKTCKKELHVIADSDKIIEIQGTVIHGTPEKTISGVLIVMHDVTHLKRLENIRRDFVANVSHELRTPLTSIKGFVETLLEGAMQIPNERERFLTIINNHVNRLNTLIEDLLTISRLEKEEACPEFHLEPVPLDRIINNAVEVCAQKALQKHIAVSIHGERMIKAALNESLFEHALINLIDNAVKYSEEKTRVTITTKVDEKNILIAIADQGPGISKEHIPRLFERFYRVDKARSRKMGGTGLGLAIVKHIVNVHSGTVTVESHIGKGSVFYITLPKENAAIETDTA